MNIYQKIEKINQLNCAMAPENATLSPDAVKRLIAQTCEEVGKVHGAARSYFGRPYSPEKTSSLKHITEELGDAITMLLLIGSLFGITLDDALDCLIEKLEKRNQEGKNVGVSFINNEIKYASQHQPFKYDVDDIEIYQDNVLSR